MESLFVITVCCILVLSIVNCSVHFDTIVPEDVSNSESFQCTTQGRFPDLASKDCRTYYSCNVNAYGDLVATLLSCPGLTLFSKDTNKCVLNTLYTCPIYTPSTEMSTTEAWLPVTTPTLEFNCPDVGRFAHPGSTNCQHYFLCTVNKDGNLQALPAKCPSSTFFSPEAKKCVVNQQYQCNSSLPETQTTSEVYSTQQSQECSEPGRFPDRQSADCKSYIFCTLDISGILIGTLVKCPQSTIFSWNEKRCVLNHHYNCPNADSLKIDSLPSSTESISTPPIVSFEQSTVNYECINTGRFPNLESPDCTTYFICTMGLDGTMIAMLASCPANTLFSWELYACVLSSSYVCPNLSTLSPTTSETPELPSSTESIASTSTASTVSDTNDEPSELTTEGYTSTTSSSSTTTTAENFVCTSTGSFPDPENANCSKFRYCLQTTNGDFLEYTFACPAGTYFDPVESHCSDSYLCPFTSNPPSEPPSTTGPFTCTEDGRFPDPDSIACSTFIHCLQTATGEFLKHIFSCPKGSLFDPYERRCSAAYVC